MTKDDFIFLVETQTPHEFIYKGKIVMTGSPLEIMEETGVSSIRDAFYKIVEKEGMKNED